MEWDIYHINWCKISSINSIINYPWTPKPWKMKVLNPQCMGYNPLKMKEPCVPMVNTWLTVSLWRLLETPTIRSHQDSSFAGMLQSRGLTHLLPWGGLVVSKIFYFYAHPWGNEPIWRAYFWNGLKPPPSPKFPWRIPMARIGVYVSLQIYVKINHMYHTWYGIVHDLLNFGSWANLWTGCS